MKLLNLERVSDHSVEKWLCENIKELTPYQKQCLRDDEIVRFAPFEFYKRTKRVENIFIRLTVIFLPFVWIFLFIGLPLNFIIKGRWGYGGLKWFSKWTNACGV